MDIVPALPTHLKWIVWSYLDCMSIVHHLKIHNALEKPKRFLKIIRCYQQLSYDIEEASKYYAYQYDYMSELFDRLDYFHQWFNPELFGLKI